MRSRTFLSVIAVSVALSGTTACSSKSDKSQSMAPQGNDSFSAGYNQSPPAPLNPYTAKLSPAATGAPGNYPASQNYSVSVDSGPRTITTATTTTTRRDNPQIAPNLVPSTHVGQAARPNSAQAGGSSGYPQVNPAAIPSNDPGLDAANNQYSGSGAYQNAEGGDADRHVRVNVPLVHVNVDRDSGGVHIDAPFVHINKPSRYDQSQVSVPDRPYQ